MINIHVKGIVFYSNKDEMLFFDGLESISFLYKIYADGEMLIDVDKINDEELINFFIVLYRYNVDIKPLSTLLKYSKKEFNDLVGRQFNTFNSILEKHESKIL